MKQRIHVITLGVDDLDRSLAFYRALGLESRGVVGTEWVEDEDNAAGAVAFFELDGGLILSLYPRRDLAKDAELAVSRPAPPCFSIGHAVGSRDDVDALLSTAEAVGATLVGRAHDRPWGIYSGYFQDPDGHLWEIVWNPALVDI